MILVVVIFNNSVKSEKSAFRCRLTIGIPLVTLSCEDV